MTQRMRKRFLDCSEMTMEEAESWGKELAETQRDIMFQLGDLYRYCEAKFGEEHVQVWPEWISPGMLQRAAGVCRAYPTEEHRQIEATYSQFMQNASRADRQERLKAIVDEGLTTDESRKASKEERANDNRPRWLIAFDLHYIVHRNFYAGAGVETAMQVAGWIQRTVERLKEKGASDVLCAFEGMNNFRKSLTEGEEWADSRYKGNRGPKPHDLLQQLQLVRELLNGLGFCCMSSDSHEADDVLASAATQFPGKITIVSGDKDLNQTLCDRVNILRDVEWVENEQSGELQPEYKWWTAKMLFEETGLTPLQYVESQVLSGDSTDAIAGCAGIGVKGAADLVKEFGTVEAVIQAAKDGDPRITAKKRESLIAFEGKHEVTRQLVTLRTDLQLPSTTKI